MNSENNTKNNLFPQALSKFLIEINGLHVALPIIMKSLENNFTQQISGLEAFLDEKNEPINREELREISSELSESDYIISAEHIYELKKLIKENTHIIAASKMVPKSFLVALVSQYDAFMGSLIKAIFFARPELLNNSKKQLSFSDLVSFSSLEEARNYISEKEIEAVLRENHVEHFKWLEAKLKMPLRDGLEIWPNFIELTQRRNLFVHTDGVVSSQYIETCKENEVSMVNEIEIGDKLYVDKQYFDQAYEILFEISTKLCQVAWRKLIPTDSDTVNEHLNGICYDLLKEEKYELAKTLLKFSLSKPLKRSNRFKFIFTVNYIIALKWGGQPDEALHLLNSTDWSACSIEFQLVTAVLRNDYDVATEVMKQIGESGSVKKEDYKDWPAFKDFRHTQAFLDTYESVFGNLLERVSPIENRILEDDIEFEKSQLIEDLSNSRSFLNTHEVIEKLERYFEFSPNQVNKIIEATINNSQISSIINDYDVREFITRVIGEYKDDIKNEHLEIVAEMLSDN